MKLRQEVYGTLLDRIEAMHQAGWVAGEFRYRLDATTGDPAFESWVVQKRLNRDEEPGAAEFSLELSVELDFVKPTEHVKHIDQEPTATVTEIERTDAYVIYEIQCSLPVVSEDGGDSIGWGQQRTALIAAAFKSRRLLELRLAEQDFRPGDYVPVSGLRNIHARRDRLLAFPDVYLRDFGLNRPPSQAVTIAQRFDAK